MNPGALDREISMRPITRASDGVGYSVESKGTAVTMWAQVKAAAQGSQPAGNEQIGNDRVRSYESRVFIIRWYSGLAPGTHMIEFDGKDWDIVAIEEIDRQNFLNIKAVRYQ